MCIPTKVRKSEIFFLQSVRESGIMVCVRARNKKRQVGSPTVVIRVMKHNHYTTYIPTCQHKKEKKRRIQ